MGSTPGTSSGSPENIIMTEVSPRADESFGSAAEVASAPAKNKKGLGLDFGADVGAENRPDPERSMTVNPFTDATQRGEGGLYLRARLDEEPLRGDQDHTNAFSLGYHGRLYEEDPMAAHGYMALKLHSADPENKGEVIDNIDLVIGGRGQFGDDGLKFFAEIEGSRGLLAEVADDPVMPAVPLPEKSPMSGELNIGVIARPGIWHQWALGAALEVRAGSPDFEHSGPYEYTPVANEDGKVLLDWAQGVALTAGHSFANDHGSVAINYRVDLTKSDGFDSLGQPVEGRATVLSTNIDYKIAPNAQAGVTWSLVDPVGEASPRENYLGISLVYTFQGL